MKNENQAKKSELLNARQIVNLKSELKNDWEVIDNKKIKHQFVFKDFLEAINFINKIARAAEEMSHHPNILVCYNKITIEIWTHKSGGLTELDFELARKIERFE
jgi:4a-hydroxytetrahydrobiopterin dehydratase